MPENEIATNEECEEEREEERGRCEECGEPENCPGSRLCAKCGWWCDHCREAHPVWDKNMYLLVDGNGAPAQVCNQAPIEWCPACKKIFPSTEMEGNVCKECAANLQTCAHCGNIVRWIDEDGWCKACNDQYPKYLEGGWSTNLPDEFTIATKDKLSEAEYTHLTNYYGDLCDTLGSNFSKAKKTPCIEGKAVVQNEAVITKLANEVQDFGASLSIRSNSSSKSALNLAMALGALRNYGRAEKYLNTLKLGKNADGVRATKLINRILTYSTKAGLLSNHPIHKYANTYLRNLGKASFTNLTIKYGWWDGAIDDFYTVVRGSGSCQTKSNRRSYGLGYGDLLASDMDLIMLYEDGVPIARQVVRRLIHTSTSIEYIMPDRLYLTRYAEVKDQIALSIYRWLISTIDHPILIPIGREGDDQHAGNGARFRPFTALRDHITLVKLSEGRLITRARKPIFNRAIKNVKTIPPYYHDSGTSTTMWLKKGKCYMRDGIYSNDVKELVKVDELERTFAEAILDPTFHTSDKPTPVWLHTKPKTKWYPIPTKKSTQSELTVNLPKYPIS